VALSAGEIEVGGVRIAYRRRTGGGPPTLFVHGVPTDSRQWLPFLERASGDSIALDLPGFGASEHPDAKRFDYSLQGLAGSVAAFRDALGIGEYSLVVQDWGVVGLIAAFAEPARLRRLVVINSVPIMPGYRWHRTARIWRTRGFGELQLASVRRPFAALALREARPGFKPLPPAFVDMVTANLRDPVTRAAILRLYRAADPPRLAAAGTGLGGVGCPALVLWGTADPFIDAGFARSYAERLPESELVELGDAGHWPWLDRPDVVERTLSFLADRT
jgi:pimeloyl-ACP methyl ester carboxylesterase